MPTPGQQKKIDRRREIDVEILSAIRNGKRHFNRIWASLDPAKEITSRQCDDRLQVLKRRGTIHYHGQKASQGWHEVKK